MATCPECKEQIDSLNVVVNERNIYSYKDGVTIDPENITFEIQYCKCPKCHKSIDEIEPDEDSMNDFLAGITELREL